eukprot:EG_transcript_8216
MDGTQYFVGGLSPETTDDDLRVHFEAFGAVLEAKVMRLKGTSQSRGFGFVTIQEDELALTTSEHCINGKVVEVKLAVPAHEMHLLVKTRRCFVGALPRDILVEELAAHFQQFGRVTAVELLHEKGTGKFLNCAFVTFENDDGADCAVRCSVHEFRGKRADVKKADPKPQRETMGPLGVPLSPDWAPSPAGGRPGAAFPAALMAGPPPPYGGPSPGARTHWDSAAAAFGPPAPLPLPGQKPRRAQDVTGMYFVGGLNRATTNEDLRDYFLRFGEVKQARVVVQDGKSRGFGFVTFTSPEEAVRNGLMVHAHTLQGNTLDVKSAVPEEELATVMRTRRIFIGALPPTATTEVLWEHFQQFGRIVDCEIVYDKVTKRPKGCGFVVFESEDHAENAVRFPSHLVLGQRVDVKKAEPRSMQPGNPNYQVTHGLAPPGAQGKKQRRSASAPDAQAESSRSVESDPTAFIDPGQYSPFF